MKRSNFIGTVVLVCTLVITGNSFAGNGYSEGHSAGNKWVNAHERDDDHFKHDRHDYDKREKKEKDRYEEHEKNQVLNPAAGLFMTDSLVTVPKNNQTFGWSETPFAFLQFDRNTLNLDKPLKIKYKWIDSSGTVVYTDKIRITDFSESDLTIWNSPRNWEGIKSPGEWTVQAKWKNPHGGKGREEINFAVAPEPLSSVLFIAGGLVIAGRRYIRRNRKR